MCKDTKTFVYFCQGRISECVVEILGGLLELMFYKKENISGDPERHAGTRLVEILGVRNDRENYQLALALKEVLGSTKKKIIINETSRRILWYKDLFRTEEVIIQIKEKRKKWHIRVVRYY